MKHVVAKTKYYFANSSESGFDEDGYAEYELPWKTLDDFKNALNTKISLTKTEFDEHCILADEVVKVARKKTNTYSYIDSDDVYILHDTEKDIYYFFLT